MKNTIAILDLGGQYAHMIGRRLRDLGVNYELIRDSENLSDDAPYGGYILSGGPQSVLEEDAPTIPEWVATQDKPVLGICYGHQLLAKLSGFDVEKGEAEFGPALLEINSKSRLFKGFPPSSQVWMSHQDSISNLGRGFSRTASTKRCSVASFSNDRTHKYGVQFHPEVDHSEYGIRLLENFVRDICGIRNQVSVRDQIDLQLTKIADHANGRKIFFFVSGGVDSMVAFTLCAKAVGSGNVKAIYVDTGFMRDNETQEIIDIFESLGLSECLMVLNEQERFFRTLFGIIDPEEKRAKIGKAFVNIQAEQLSELDTSEWILGQGTIYPDTVESGGDGNNTAKIKTHHNRCAEVLEMIAQGQVIEPIRDFYKDEVRVIGAELGLSELIVGRWPFPGPGLAIRCLCSDDESSITERVEIPGHNEVTAMRFPVRSVGVQGDGRTYRDAVALFGNLAYEQLQTVSVTICNTSDDFNRVIYHLSGNTLENGAKRKASAIDEHRIGLLQQADSIARRLMVEGQAYDSVWQFPVVMVPVSSNGKDESIILRPVNSHDGMTANFARLDNSILKRIADEIANLDGIDAVYLDVSDKPPATIEWE